MKIKFEFNLPEDQREYEVAQQANKMQSFLWAFSHQLREYEKYGHNFTDANNAVSRIREEFYRILDNHKVNIDL